MKGSGTSFVRALSGSCAGTRVFDALKEQSLLRTVLHTLLLALICSLFVAWRWSAGGEKSLADAAAQLERAAGGVKISGDGIQPLKNADQPLEFDVMKFLRVFYLPEYSDQSLAGVIRANAEGIYWSPRLIATWRTVDENHYAVTMGFPSAVNFPQEVNSRDLDLFLRQMPDAPDKLDLPDQELTARELLLLARPMYFLMIWAGNFLQMAFLAFLLTGIFSIMFHWSGRRNSAVHWTLKSLYVTALYAGFPGMLIGSVFTAFELPYVSYPVLYTPAMAFYLLYILNRMELKARSGPEQERR